jgi:nicotinamide-nucleotide amidase
MTACILAVGDELVWGLTVDRHGAYLSRRLSDRGIEVVEHATVGDDRGRIARALGRAGEEVDLVVVTGGLGPTSDDVTRHALADALGVELVLDERVLADLEERFRRLGRTMVAQNRIQAMIPQSAEALRNEVGTAAGIAATLGRARVFVLPGVPHEMEWMFEHRVAPLLPAGGGGIAHRDIHVFGTGESNVAAAIADLMRREGDVVIGTTVSAGLITVRITSRAGDARAAREQMDRSARGIHRRLGEMVLGEGDATMSSVVGQQLRAKRATLATAESCTGGLIGRMITDTPGSSEYYVGGVVAYSNALKQELLGVEAELLASHGAVSEAVAAAMAEGCRARLASDWTIAVTGIAGPGGASENKPVGLVYASLAGPGTTKTSRYVFGGDRDTVRRRAALAALNELRLALREA